MEHSDLTGLRCVSVVRSALYEASPALEGQRLANRSFAAQAGLMLVDEVVLRGTPHGIPRATLHELVQRKVEANDFEAILVSDLSRLARGSLHLGHVLNLLTKSGVRVVSMGGSCGGQAGWAETFAEEAYRFVREERKLRRGG